MNYKIDIPIVFYDPLGHRPEEADEDQGPVERLFCSITCAENYNEGTTGQVGEGPGEVEDYPDAIEEGTQCDWCHQALTNQ
jgi:hypothetical protein